VYLSNWPVSLSVSPWRTVFEASNNDGLSPSVWVFALYIFVFALS